jgi:hypothetical protein
METWIKIHQKFKRRIRDHCIGVVKCESKNSDIEYSQYPVTFVFCSVWIHDRLFRKRNNKGFCYPYTLSVVCGNTVGWGTVLQAVRSQWGHWNFFPTKYFWLHYGPGVDSASNRNEYQEHFLGSKGSRCIGLTTIPPSCANWKSGSIALLELSGPVQACTGIVVLYIKHHAKKYREWRYRVVHL